MKGNTHMTCLELVDNLEEICPREILFVKYKYYTFEVYE